MSQKQIHITISSIQKCRYAVLTIGRRYMIFTNDLYYLGDESLQIIIMFNN